MPPDPPKWCMCCRTLFNRPLKLSLCCVLPPLVIFSKRNPETGQHPQLFPYSASSINATVWSHSIPQTLTSIQANKSSTTTSTCTIVVGTWKAPCTKLWLLVKIVKQLAGTIKALWHKSPALWSMGFVPSGRHTAALGYKSHTTRSPWYNYNFTLYSLQCTPQPTIPTNQSYYSQQRVYTQPFQNNE